MEESKKTAKDTFLEVAVKLDSISSEMQLITSDSLQPFKNAYQSAFLIGELRKMLTPEYMKPIMLLQGSSLGFKTDRDIPREGQTKGYSEEVVKECVIAAIRYGLSVIDNQFNIIGGNMYVTINGIKVLLKKIHGLTYKTIPLKHEIAADGKSGTITMRINWNLNGSAGTEDYIVTTSAKGNQIVTVDNLVGKARRKAEGWLYTYVTGNPLDDGDVVDTEVKIINIDTKADVDTKTKQRLLGMIDKCTTKEQLESLRKNAADNDCMAYFDNAYARLK